MSEKSGSDKRRASEIIRISPAAKATLMKEADKRGATMAATLESLLPTKKDDSAGRCRNCNRLMLNPAKRQKFHETDCVLFHAQRA